MNRVILGIVVYAVSSISALAQWTLPEIKVSDINVGDTVYLFNKEAVGFMRGLGQKSAPYWGTRAGVSIEGAQPFVFMPTLAENVEEGTECSNIYDIPWMKTWDGETYIIKTYANHITSPRWDEMYFGLMDYAGIYVDRQSNIDANVNFFWNVERNENGSYCFSTSKKSTFLADKDLYDILTEYDPATGKATISPVIVGGERLGVDLTSADRVVCLEGHNKGQQLSYEWWIVKKGGFDQKALVIYKTAVELGKLIDDIKTKYVGIDLGAAEKVYGNTASTLEELQEAMLLIEKAIKIYLSNNTTKDTPTDMSFAIKNATFDTEYDYSGWEGDSFRGYRPVSTCGGFTGDDTWQDLENLPEGMYRVGVRGLYCYDNNTEDWTRKDDLSVRYAKLYGQSGENRLYHELPTISSAASESKVEGLGTYNDNGMYVPYNMEEFTAFKNAGLVKETSVLVPVGKDGKLRIGMSRDYMKVSIDLCFVDDFSLTYYGNSDDAFYMWRDEVIGTSLNKEKIAEHKVVYNKTYMEKYDKTINDAKNAGNKDDITVCVPKVKIAADSLVENISAYYWYGQLVEDIREYFNKYPDMTDENTAGLKSYVFTYFEPNGTFPNGSALYILDKAGLTTEEIRAEHTVISRTFRDPVHTSIEKVEDNSDGVRTDNAIYDLMGRRLNGVPAKGFYIQNGKKYVR